jgi:hypothetical protein
MNTMLDTGRAGAAAAHAQRCRRTVIAERLIARAPGAVKEVDWDALEAAPAWLALPDAQLLALQRQVGAVVYAPQMRLWIDGARLAAVRAAVGDSFLQALLAQRDAPLPHELLPLPRIELAAQLTARLQAAGAAVLLASIAPGPLRRAAGAVLGLASAPALACELAQSLVARAQSIAAAPDVRRPTRDAPGSAR